MSNKKTSEETLAGPLDGTELVRIVQDGASVRTTAQDIADLASQATDTVDLPGTTAGHAYWHMPQTGPGAKEVVVVLAGYRNSTGTPQTITFPTAFERLSLVFPNSDPEATASLTTLTLPASMSGAIDAVIIVKGI